MPTARSKALRSPAEENPFSQTYLMTQLLFSVSHTNIPQHWGLLPNVAPAPYNSVSQAVPSSVPSCPLSLLLSSPARLSAPDGQGPSFPVDSHVPLHPGGGPQVGLPGIRSRRVSRGREATRAGLGGACGFTGPLPPIRTCWGVGTWGSPHLAAGTVLPAEQQQQGREQQEEDEQGDEPPEGAGRALWGGRGKRKESVPCLCPPPPGAPTGRPPPPAGLPAHPSSSAPGRCCWARGRHHPRRCNCRYSRRPRPGRSSTPPPPPLHPQTVSRAPKPPGATSGPGEASTPHHSPTMGPSAPPHHFPEEDNASSRQTVLRDGARRGPPPQSVKGCKSVPVLGITQELGF